MTAPEGDSALLARARSGDREALESLLSSIAPTVRRFGLRMCRHDADADEVLQDTLLAVTKNLPAFEGKSSLASWVFTLARTACNRRRRGMKNAPHTAAEDAPEPIDAGDTPEERAAHRQLVARVEEAIASLPDEQREVLLLRDVEGLSAADAAAAIGISVDALKSRLHRARAALEQRVAQAITPSAGCPDVAALFSRKLEGELAPRDCAEMEKHMASCRSCTAACDALREALATCKTFGEKKIDPVVQERIRTAVRAAIAR